MDQVKVAPVGDATVTSGTVEASEGNNLPENVKDVLEKFKKEKENWKNKAIELEKQVKAVTEKELIEKENWKALAEQRLQSIQELEAKDKINQEKEANALKIATLQKELSKLGMDMKYFDIAVKAIDLKTLTVDKDANLVLGVESAVKALRESASPLFTSAPSGVSHAAPQGITEPLTLEAWKAMPYEEKIKHEKQIYESVGIKLKP
jgi:hypothetical protein